MVNDEKCFLLHFSLGPKPSRARIAEAARQIKQFLRDISPDHQLAYTSADGTAFGFLFKSSLLAGQITRRLNSPGGSAETGNLKPCILLNEDSALVLEIGSDVSGIGKTKVHSWFRFHSPTSTAQTPITVSPEPGVPSQLASQLAAIKDKIGK